MFVITVRIIISDDDGSFVHFIHLESMEYYEEPNFFNSDVTFLFFTYKGSYGVFCVGKLRRVPKV